MKPSQKAIIEIVKKLNRPKLLDFGSKTGSFWEQLEPYAEVYGCDISLHPEMAERVKHTPERFQLSSDPKKIPFNDEKFDIIFANSVFEHVEPLTEIVAECARVLKPGGRLIAIFPTKSVIIEPHVGVPFATRLKPGAFRRRWMAIAYRIGFGKNYVAVHGDPKTSSEIADKYMSTSTHYHYYGTYRRLFEKHFNNVFDRTEFVMRLGNVPAIPGLSYMVARFYAVCFDAEKSRT